MKKNKSLKCLLAVTSSLMLCFSHATLMSHAEEATPDHNAPAPAANAPAPVANVEVEAEKPVSNPDAPNSADSDQDTSALDHSAPANEPANVANPADVSNNDASSNPPSTTDSETSTPSHQPSTSDTNTQERPRPGEHEPIIYLGDIRIRYDKSAIPTFKDEESADLVLTLQNFGIDPAENIVLTPILSENKDLWPFEIEKNDYSVHLKELKPLSKVAKDEMYEDEDGKKHPYGQVRIKGLKMQKGVREGYLPIKFNITYFNKRSGIKNIIENSRYFIKHEVTPAPSETPTTNEVVWSGGGGGSYEEPKTNTPRFLLIGFETQPPVVEAGKYFKLKLNFHNSSLDKGLQNIKLTLSSAESSFLPKTGSSTLFIDKVDKNSDRSTEIELLPLATLEQKPHPISIKIEYETDTHEALNSEESISIPVTQKARCEISRVEIQPEEVNVGDSALLNFSVHNKGKSKLYNVSVVFPKDGPVEVPDEFIGNIDSGSQGTAEITLVPTRALNPDEKPYFEVTFEDELGKVSRIKQEYKFDIIDMGNTSGEMDGMLGSEYGASGEGDMGSKEIMNEGNPEFDPSMDGQSGMENGSGLKAKFMHLPLWAKIASPSALALVLIGLGVGLRRRHLRKKLNNDEI